MKNINMLKRIFCGILAVAILSSCAGCKKSVDGSSSKSGTSVGGGEYDVVGKGDEPTLDELKEELGIPDLKITGEKVTYLNWMPKEYLDDPQRTFYHVSMLMQKYYGCSLEFITEISLFENDACIYSPVKNNCIAVPFKNKDDRIAFSYDFAPYGSVLIKCGVKESISPVCNDIVCSVDLKDEWQIKTCSPNALALDFCKYRIDDGGWQNPCTVIQLQQRLLQLKKPCKTEMEFSFRIEQNGLPDDLSLCMENPQLYRIEINGKPFEFSAEGYFVDKSIVKCNIAPHVKSGVNTIGLSCNYYQSPKVYEVLFAPDMCASERNKLTYDTELESIYLVGSFGVKNDAPYSYGERRAIHTSGDFCLTSLPKTVNATHITESGFWFFLGALELTQRVIVSKDISEVYCSYY